MMHNLFSAISAICASHMYPAASHENKIPYLENDELKEKILAAKAEQTAQIYRDFDDIDLNRDGMISKEEYINFRTRISL